MMPRPMRILVSEDDETSRRAVVMRLSGRFPDAKIIEAATYAETCREIETADVCVLDLYLGDAKLEQVLDLIYHNPDVSVVAYSSTCDTDIAEQAVEAGAIQFVSKRCPPNMLPVSVSMALRIRQRLLELGRASDEATKHINETLALLGAK